MYYTLPRLTVIGESKTQLGNTTLREWLGRAGLRVCSGWPNDPPGCKPEEVDFVELFDKTSGVPQLALGKDIVEALTGYAVALHKVRGSILPKKLGGWIVATMSPEDLGINKGQDHLKPLIGNDAQRAMENGNAGPIVPKITYLESPEDLKEYPNRGAVVSVDIEGAHGKPNIVGVCWEETQVYVFPWSEELRLWLTKLFASDCIPVFHNANFDVAELKEAGVTPPSYYLDTIVMAGLYDSSQPMNLQWQVLTHVPGSTCWKGLIDHEKGPDFDGKNVGMYRRLWTNILSRLNRPAPITGHDWYVFYNGLDTSHGLALANQFERKLKIQNRWGYYLDVLQPLQHPLLKMGTIGMPLDTFKLKVHQTNCGMWKEEAKTVLMEVGKEIAMVKCRDLLISHDILVKEREAERATGVRKFTKATELSGISSKLKVASDFNPDSPKQLAELLYDFFGLPVVYTEKRGRSVAEDAVESLISRVVRGTVKVKGDKDLCLKVLTNITKYNHWTHWEGTFLNPPIQFDGVSSSLGTTYSLHRSLTGRLTSGLDNSDLDKGGKRQRKVNLQNWPKEIRDIIVAPKGYYFVGGDYSGIEWAICMWMVSKIYNDGYHIEMLNKFFDNRFDPHDLLAKIADCTRTVAKVFTHGYDYDGNPKTLARNAGLADAVGIKVCMAHDVAFKTRKWKDITVVQAKKAHRIDTSLGWRVYNWAWKPKPSEILAWIVQGTAADLCKWVMKDIFETLPSHSRLVTSTHDSYLLQVPEDKVAESEGWLRAKMQQPIPWLDGRQWRAEIKTGKTWKDVS